MDWLPKPSAFEPMYHVIALKSEVIGYWPSFLGLTTPEKKAEQMRTKLVRMGHKVQIVRQPDPAVPAGSVVLILSSAFLNHFTLKREDLRSGLKPFILPR